MPNISGDYKVTLHPWEAGLPNLSDLPPLTKLLIPPELLSAFNIRPEPRRTSGDVSRASQETISTIRGSDSDEEGSNSKKKPRRKNSPEFSADGDESSAPEKDLKNTRRLVWTPQLHKRFVEVVAHLGFEKAVPKTIMELMNVEGLTRENVASHLQKYRLFLKRNSPEQLFSSSPENSPENLPENGNLGFPISMPYAPPMMPMPVPIMNGFGSDQNQNRNQFNYHNHHDYYHQYNNMMYGSGMGYYQHLPPHVTPGGR